MDGDFQSNYLAAEKAYGAGDFEAAQSITLELLSQLEPLPEEGAERDAVLAWRAFVALLAGHIDLYGFQEPAQARRFYQLVLASNPQDTLRELAEQGLERTRSTQEVVNGSEQLIDPGEDQCTQPVQTTGSHALIADPFLSAASAVEDSLQPTAITTAMPWLKDEPIMDIQDRTLSNQINAPTDPEPEPEPQPETTSTISEINTEINAEPSDSVLDQTTSHQINALANPEPEPEPQPETTSTISKINTEINAEPSDSVLDQTTSHQINAPTDPEPEPEPQPIRELEPEPDCESEPSAELADGATMEAMTITTKALADTETNEAIRQRLEAGSLLVKLPDTALKPTKQSSEGDQPQSRWSWLRAALRSR